MDKMINIHNIECVNECKNKHGKICKCAICIHQGDECDTCRQDCGGSGIEFKESWKKRLLFHKLCHNKDLCTYSHADWKHESDRKQMRSKI